MEAAAQSGPGPTTPPLAARSGAARHNVELVLRLAVTNFKLKYTGSVLGYVWSLIKPLMIFGVTYLVFVRLLNAGARSPSFPLQLLIGIVLWNFIGETTGSALSSVVASSQLIKKAYFPRPVLVLASILTASMTFAINMCLIVIIAGVLGGLDLRLSSLLAIAVVIEMYLLVIGLGLLLSSLFVFFRDVGHIWEIMLQLLFYGSAVVYPLNFAPGFAHWLALNPVAQIINDFRYLVVTRNIPTTADILGIKILIPIGLVFASLIFGSLLFSRVAPDFAEQL
jgi:ABC-2 type transport system permease protein